MRATRRCRISCYADLLVVRTGLLSLTPCLQSATCGRRRDGAGYLLQDQLLRLTQLLVAVAAAGRLLLGLPALAPESQHPSPAMRPDAIAAGVSPMEGSAAGGMPSPSAGGGGGARGHGAHGHVHDASRGLLEEALLRAFREHAVHDPSGVAPPRLTGGGGGSRALARSVRRTSGGGGGEDLLGSGWGRAQAPQVGRPLGLQQENRAWQWQVGSRAGAPIKWHAFATPGGLLLGVYLSHLRYVHLVRCSLVL